MFIGAVCCGVLHRAVVFELWCLHLRFPSHKRRHVNAVLYVGLQAPHQRRVGRLRVTSRDDLKSTFFWRPVRRCSYSLPVRRKLDDTWWEATARDPRGGRTTAGIVAVVEFSLPPAAEVANGVIELECSS